MMPASRAKQLRIMAHKYSFVVMGRRKGRKSALSSEISTRQPINITMARYVGPTVGLDVGCDELLDGELAGSVDVFCAKKLNMTV